MKKTTPFLWFDTQAEEAMNFYVSIFKNSKVGNVSRGPDGKVFTVSFELDGQEFMALNAGPSSNSMRPYPSSSVARRRRKWIITGKDLPQTAARKACAAGSKTSTACRGRSFPPR